MRSDEKKKRDEVKWRRAAAVIDSVVFHVRVTITLTLYICIACTYCKRCFISLDVECILMI